MDDLVQADSLDFFECAVKNPQNQLFFYGFCLIQLNTCMTRKKEQPFEAPPITEATTAYRTDRWLKSVHITPEFLSDTSIATEFLQAQREAETLLRNFPEHLSRSQSYQLVDFLRCLGNRKQRQRMSIARAYAVLNIAAKINRQCFREYRALNQQEKQQDKLLANKG